MLLINSWFVKENMLYPLVLEAHHLGIKQEMTQYQHTIFNRINIYLVMDDILHEFLKN